VEEEDLKPFQKHGALAGLEFQKSIERKAYIYAGNKDNKGQFAPAQRLKDFIKGEISSDLPKCSYTPGVVSAPVHEILPKAISSRLQEGFKAFGSKMKGYLDKDVLLLVLKQEPPPLLKYLEIKSLYNTPILKVFIPVVRVLVTLEE
jgi:uncharacterized FAD-dependent dehydrogenase